MLKNGVKFVKVVRAPTPDELSLLNGADTSLPVMLDLYLEGMARRNMKVDGNVRENVMCELLGIVKAEFSCIDIRNMVPIYDEVLPEDFLIEKKFGNPAFNPAAPFLHGPALVDEDKMYQVHPTTFKLEEIEHMLPQAKKWGHYSSFSHEELLLAQDALSTAHTQILIGLRHFEDFEPVRSMVLSGAQIKAGCQEDRQDVLLNVLFDRPTGYKRLAQLAVPGSNPL